MEQPGVEWNAHFLCISPDGRQVFTAGGDTGQVWEVETGKPLTRPLQLSGLIHRAAFGPDGRALLTLSGRWWDAVPGGNWLITLGHRWSDVEQPGLQVRVWATATGAPAGTVLQPRGAVQAAALVSGGRRVVTASEDTAHQVWLTEWDVATGKAVRSSRKLQTLLSEGLSIATDRMAFSADGRLVATTFENTARVWDVATGRALTPPLPQGGGANGAFFSPDGRCLAVQVNLDSLQLWEIPSGRRIGRSIHHSAALWEATFSPDGRYLSTAGADNTSRVWDAATGEPITPPLPGHGIAMVAEISPDGRQLVTSNEQDGTLARLWSLAPDEHLPGDLARLAQLLTGENLDPTAGLVPLASQALQAAWNDRHTRNPDAFSSIPARIFEWHGREAVESEWQRQWTAAIFHYDQALATQPENDGFRRSRSRVAFGATVASPLFREELAQRIPPRDAPTTPGMVDLTPFYDVALTDPLDGSFSELSTMSLSALPAGVQRLGEVEFDVRGAVQLANSGDPTGGVRRFPVQVSDIPVRRPFRYLHLLHGTAPFTTPLDGTPTATLVLHYDDGSERSLPIRYGSQSNATLAWTGTANRATIRLYRSTWENPQPGKMVVSIDIVSTMSGVKPLIVAMTLE